MASHCTRVIKLEDGIISSDTAQRQKKEREQLIRPTPIKDNIDKKEIFSFAKNNILNKASFKRNLLVSIALGIGICAFVLMLFLGAGLKQYVETEMDTGSNKLQINVQKNTLGTFTSTETNYFKNGIIDGVAGVYEATAVSDLKLTYKVGTAVNNILYGASIYDGFQMKLQYGNLPNNSISAEILISSAMARRLLTDENLEISTVIGQSAVLTYNGGSDKTFTICGIFEDDTYDTVYVSKGGLSFTNLGTNLLYVIGTDVAHINAIIDDIGYLITNAVVTRMDTKAEDILGYIDMGSMMLSVVSLIALVVSAIMIFIVMYISVVERTKEIGILRALGVRRKDVKRIFITEAGIIGIVAGFMGCIAALILGLVVPIMSVNVWYLLLGLGISFVLSVVSSFGPSGSASSLDPIEALRTE
jgi:ABC-type antimicrobial peptide transport system permease subunit